MINLSNKYFMNLSNKNYIDLSNKNFINLSKKKVNLSKKNSSVLILESRTVN